MEMEVSLLPLLSHAWDLSCTLLSLADAVQDSVRTKKGTYAESQTSDFSHDSSPGEDEEESSVKSTSEWSGSPELSVTM